MGQTHPGHIAVDADLLYDCFELLEAWDVFWKNSEKEHG